MKKIAGIALIALPFAIFGAIVTPLPDLIHAITIIGASLLGAGLIIGGVELIDSHNASR